MATTYTWAPDNSRMRAVSLVPFGASGLFLPLWPRRATPLVWTYTGTTLASDAIGGLPTNSGFGAACSDGASGAWTIQYNGSLVHYTSGATVTSFAAASGTIFNGAAYVPAYTAPYFSDVQGNIYTGSTLAPVSPGFSVPTWGLAVSGSTLFAVASGNLAAFSLYGFNYGAPSYISYPLAEALCLAASTAASAVAMGGWLNYTLASGYTNMAFSSAAPVMVGLSGGHNIDLYLGVAEAWALSSTTVVTGNPKYSAWVSGGTSVLITDPTAGTLNVYGYSLGNLALNQSLAIPGAGPIAIAPDGTHALVCQTAQNTVTPLTLSAGVWSSGAALSVGSPLSIAAAASAAAVGCSSGIANFTLSGGVWSPSAIAAVPFNPSAVAYASGNVLAAGTAGGSGYFSAASGSVVLFTYGWTGSATDMIYDQGQVTVTDPSGPLLYAFQNIFTQYGFVFNITPTQQFAKLAVSPFTATSSGGTIFGMAATSTSLYTYTTPFNLEPLRSGAVSIYTSGGWATATLGSGHVPTAMTFDASGNIWAATLQNDLYKISVAGGLLSTQTITQFSGQAQGTPIGISSMAFVGSALYGASSLAGPLVRLQ